MEDRSEGRIVRFDPSTGYGFIADAAGGPDVFVHVNDVDVDVDALRSGALVEFAVVEGDRGFRAIDVTLVEEEDLVTTLAYKTELTEALIVAVPELTLEQASKIRDVATSIAAAHNWLD
ncbi:MAG: cold shock domain-containing protein [Actinomycetia bacterium]|nr:cold shock domain-containing protein [Actinomycetes bacterium]